MKIRHCAAALAGLVACLPSTGGAEEATTISHGISAFGELKYPADFAHFDYVNPNAPKGGRMSFRGQGASRTFDSLNLFILAGEPAQGLERLYDSLLARAYDEPDAAYGLIAERIEYPQDRSWVIFDLRPEARFTDGEPITADDVIFTIETLKAHGRPAFRYVVDEVETVEALGPHRVRIDFTEGASTRDLPSEVGQLPILPEHYYEDVRFDRSTLQPPVGSGRYEVADVSPGRRITYCLTGDYWADGLPVNVGADNFDCVVYEYFADSTAAFEAFKVGAYLMHEEYSSALWATNYDFPALEKGWVVQAEIPDGRPSGAQGFYLNLRREKLSDPRVRQAIGMMFNFEWSNQTLFYGAYRRTDSFFENSEMQAEGLPEGAELALLDEYRDLLPPEIFTEPAFVPLQGSSNLSDRAAVRAASALLDEAGWRSGPDGIRRNASGERLTLEIADDGQSFERIALPFIDNLRRIGVDASFNLIDSAQMQQRQEDFDYDVNIARLVPTATPSIELRTIFGSEAADRPGSFNLSGVQDPVVDALIEAAVAATDREELVVAVRALDRVLRARHIWVPNWYKGSHWLAYWDVFGKPDIKPTYDRGLDYWWHDREKAATLREAGALRVP